MNEVNKHEEKGKQTALTSCFQSALVGIISYMVLIETQRNSFFCRVWAELCRAFNSNCLFMVRYDTHFKKVKDVQLHRYTRKSKEWENNHFPSKCVCTYNFLFQYFFFASRPWCLQQYKRYCIHWKYTKYFNHFTSYLCVSQLWVFANWALQEDRPKLCLFNIFYNHK